MPKLNFISDEDLLTITKKLVAAAKNAEAKVVKNPYKNVIDPFSSLVDAARQGISIGEWMEQEKSRQVQKAFQNAIGDFHQDIISAVPGWENAGKGGDYDVSSEGAKVIAEIKNKHNTMNSTSAAGTYDKLAGWLDHGKEDFTAYVVAIVPKSPKPFSEPFTPSQRKVRRPTRKNLLKIDGKSFYGLVTGYENSLEMLYGALPSVLEQILGVDDELLKGTAEFRKLFDKAYSE